MQIFLDTQTPRLYAEFMQRTKQIKTGDTVSFGGVRMVVSAIGTRKGIKGVTLTAPNGDDITVFENSKLWGELAA